MELGGASSVLLKSKWPNKYAYADKLGFMLEGLSKLSVRNAFGRNLSHSAIENSEHSVDNPILK